MKYIFIICCCIFTAACAFVTSSNVEEEKLPPPFLNHLESKWVDSVMHTLSPDERIAQLIVVAAYSNRGPEHRQEILKLVDEQKIGGLIFFQGGPVRQAALVNAYQKRSKVPLLIAMDAEWGLGMRLDSTISYPYQMTLGAIRDNALLYEMGQEIARQLHRAGIQVNLAPVVDVNNNPENPVINYRSFGENKFNVAQKGIAYMKGLQDNNILTTAKHFPGHGDTNTDSHYALPQINHARQRLDSLELYPFRKLIEAGVGGIMVAHLNIPALDSTKGLPSTLSKPIVTRLLRDELNFTGLIVTDAMNMKGVTASNPPGVVDKEAVLAGNDMLEFTEDVPKAIAEIRKAVEQGLISQAEIDEKCRKMLAVKEWAGLSNFQPVKLHNMVQDLNLPKAEALSKRLMKAALTVLKNDHEVLPVRGNDTVRIASVSFGVNKLTAFQTAMSRYHDITHYNLSKHADEEEVTTLWEKLKDYDIIIGALHESSTRPLNRLYISDAVKHMISNLSRRDKVIMAIFKNPYVLDKIKDIEQAPGLMVTYQDNDYAKELAAQMIFGYNSAYGRLPVSIGTKFKAGHGIDVDAVDSVKRL